MVLFCLYMIGVAVIAAWAVENGDAERLMYGADSWGNVCGRSENKKYALLGCFWVFLVILGVLGCFFGPSIVPSLK